MTSITDHVRRTAIEEICNMEKDIKVAQKWKLETALDKKKDVKQKRKSK